MNIYLTFIFMPALFIYFARIITIYSNFGFD